MAARAKCLSTLDFRGFLPAPFLMVATVATLSRFCGLFVAGRNPNVDCEGHGRTQKAKPPGTSKRSAQRVAEVMSECHVLRLMLPSLGDGD